MSCLTLKPEAHQLMQEAAMGADGDATDAQDLEREKRAAIAVLKQQLANLLDLYKNAVISAAGTTRTKTTATARSSSGKRGRPTCRRRRWSWGG